MTSEERRPYPLYSTTFTLNRLSPLYTGRNTLLDNPSLLQYSRLFRDILAGDVLRGVRVGLGSDEDALARVGPLQTVTWRLLPEEDLWNANEESEVDNSIRNSDQQGILVTVTYEKATYVAMLLGGGQEVLRGDGFQYFPLLLTRMPGSLRDTFTDFLASTFDTRVSIMHLGREYMTKALEVYISDCSMDEDGELADMSQISRKLRNVIKDVQITVGFDLPSGGPSLKTIDFLVAREDLPKIVQIGRRVEKDPAHESPFMTALWNYVNAHLALDMRHERVKILKVACGAFVLGAEGKAKLTERVEGDSVQSSATRKLVDGLIQMGRGGALTKLAHR
jgi:hypothetical protein